MTEQELLDALKKLKEAPPCPKHGRESLAICKECLEDVRCCICRCRECQCWNDE